MRAESRNGATAMQGASKPRARLVSAMVAFGWMTLGTASLWAMDPHSGHSGMAHGQAQEVGGAAPSQDHAMHQPGMKMGHEHDMHQGHGDQGGMAGADPHAHHRAMMQDVAFQRSEQRYDLPDLRLVDMNGQETSLLHALDSDKPVIVNFIFTTCTTICPVLSATFRQVQDALGDGVEDVRMVSISIDPEEDTPERLRAYAKRFHAGPEWRFFTGDLDDIIAIQKAFDVYHGNKMSHEPAILLRETAQAPWVRLDGFASARDVVKEYQQFQHVDG